MAQDFKPSLGFKAKVMYKNTSLQIKSTMPMHTPKNGVRTNKNDYGVRRCVHEHAVNAARASYKVG